MWQTCSTMRARKASVASRKTTPSSKPWAPGRHQTTRARAAKGGRTEGIRTSTIAPGAMVWLAWKASQTRLTFLASYRADLGVALISIGTLAGWRMNCRMAGSFAAPAPSAAAGDKKFSPVHQLNQRQVNFLGEHQQDLVGYQRAAAFAGVRRGDHAPGMDWHDRGLLAQPVTSLSGKCSLRRMARRAAAEP